MSYKYQNVSDVTQVLTVSGVINPREVKAGEETVSSVVIENPNFKYIGAVEDNGVQGVVTQSQPSSVTEAQRLENNETNKETI